MGYEKTTGKVWIAPEGASLEGFPDGWQELGFARMDNFEVNVDDDHIHWDWNTLPLEESVVVTIPLGGLPEELRKLLIDGFENEEDE